MKFDTLNIKYSTNQVPPPYSHEYDLTLDYSDGQLKVSFELNYTHREEISNEEVVAEGFSDNDNFQWRGDLNKVWVKVIKDLLNGIDWNSDKELSEFDQNIHIFYVKDETGEREITLYENEKVDLVLQEILQAIYETAKIESPLTIQFLDINGSKKAKTQFLVSFLDRSALVNYNGNKRNVDWNDGKHFMSQLFQPDYIAPPVKPKKKGVYISFLEDQWYQIERVEKEEEIEGLTAVIRAFLM